MQREDQTKAHGELAAAQNEIRVLNLSFPRCGTMSMQAALNQLGYKCWHSTTCFGDTIQCRRWLSAQDAKFLGKGAMFSRRDWDAVFAGCTAISADPPAHGFAEDLIAAYPDAKVILVERDEESWMASMEATVINNLFQWDMHAVADLDPGLVGPVRDMQWHWVKSWWGCRSKAETRAKARDMYREHNRKVRALVPAERLLDFHLEQGWAPLCEFLGREVPGEDFPRRNDRDQVKARNSWIRKRGMWLLSRRLLKVMLPVGFCAAAWWMSRGFLNGAPAGLY